MIRRLPDWPLQPNPPNRKGAETERDAHISMDRVQTRGVTIFCAPVQPARFPLVTLSAQLRKRASSFRAGSIEIEGFGAVARQSGVVGMEADAQDAYGFSERTIAAHSAKHPAFAT